MLSSRTKPRRGEPSRLARSKAPSWPERIRAARALLPIGLAAGFILLALLIVLSGGEPFPYRPGQTIHGKQIVARVPMHDPEKLRAQQEIEELATANHYTLNEALLKNIQASLTNLREKASANETLEALRAELASQNEQWALDAKAFSALKELADERGAARFKRLMDKMIEAAKDEPLVRTVGREDRYPPSAAQYTILHGHKPEAISNDRLKYVSNTEHVESVVSEVVRDWPKPLQAPLAQRWRQILQPDPDARVYAPVYQFDKAATDAEIKRARESVSPELVQKPAGSPICDPGVITERELEVLRIEHEAYLHAMAEHRGIWSPLARKKTGLAGIVLFIFLGLCGYIWEYGGEFVRNTRRLLAFCGVILVMLLLARLGALAGWPHELAVVPVVMTGAILAIGFNQRFAFGATAAMATLVALAAGGDFKLVIVLILSMSVTVGTLGHIRTRSKVVDAGGLTAIVAFATAACLGLLDGQALRFTGQCSLTAAASGLSAGFLIFGILPLIEKIFDVTTDLTLLEWGSVHQPLLRRLREDAPGTYSHSQTLADHVEIAAEAIGANGLLARTGAYYHDVGKIVKPNYFVENYEMQVDQHKNLQPTMSMLIIVGHVRDGLELAKQYGLPKALQAFIAEHHGTNLVEYFYHEASVRQMAEGKPGPSETEFRYPGPKPQGKETAILMLADAVESAVRAMAEPTAGRIESTVHQIAMKRLMDGQLDECSMTLKDLRRVEDCLTRSLIAMYHGRIAYPRGRGAAKQEAGEGQRSSSAG